MSKTLNSETGRTHHSIERPRMVRDRVIPPKDEIFASTGEKAATLIALGGVATGLGIAGHELYQAGLFNDMDQNKGRNGSLEQPAYIHLPLPENPSDLTITLPPQAGGANAPHQP